MRSPALARKGVGGGCRRRHAGKEPFWPLNTTFSWLLPIATVDEEERRPKDGSADARTLQSHSVPVKTGPLMNPEMPLKRHSRDATRLWEKRVFGCRFSVPLPTQTWVSGGVEGGRVRWGSVISASLFLHHAGGDTGKEAGTGADLQQTPRITAGI